MIHKTFRKLCAFLPSYGFAVILLFFLLILVFLGTVEQVDTGLYEVQKKYFESTFVVHWLFDSVPLPLPGVYLLLALLFVNMTWGAIVRAPKSWKRPGLLIAHGGILLLVLGGFITFHFSQNGHMTLQEGQASNEFESYYDWDVSITEIAAEDATGPAHRFVIPHKDIANLKGERKRVFHAPGLPFQLELSYFMKNASPRPVAPNREKGVDGVILQDLPAEKEAERNIAGLQAKLIQTNGEVLEGLLWGMSLAPWRIRVGEQDYAISLRHSRWKVPFTITLDKFTRDLHPGTSMASNFMSEITKEEDGSSTTVFIKMNEPLRSHGYTFFQASWGPQNAGPNTPLYSVFSAVKNPADQWPLYACYVITLGLLIHFAQSLLRYLRRQNRSRA